MFWNLNVGDVVKIEKKPVYAELRGANFSWHDGMDKNIGQSVTVRTVSEKGFGINEDNHYYPFSCLDKVYKVGKSGRPSKYYEINLGQVKTLAENGFTDREMCKFFDVGYTVWDNWKKVHKGLLETLKAGRELSISKADEVEKSEKSSKTRKIEDLFFESIKEYHEKRLRINQMFLEMLEIDNAIFPTFVDDLKKIIEAIEDKEPF